MAGFTSFASTALQALSVANTLAHGVDTYRQDSGTRAYEEAKAKSDAQLAGLREKTDLQKQQNDLELQENDAERRRLLRKALAQQKAVFSANGIGSANGSSQAYLLGLTDENEEVGTEKNALNQMRNNILEQNYQDQQRYNTLQLTQLKERTKLKKATALYDGLDSIF